MGEKILVLYQIISPITISSFINEIDLEVDIEKIDEKRKKVTEHWQDYKRLPSPRPV